MSENLKIRFRLPNGEEFEAEGPQDFIESQRNYFLNLIARKASFNQAFPGPITQAAFPVPQAPAQAILSTVPAALRAENSLTTLGTPERSAATTENLSVSKLWEQLLKREGDWLILRRKSHLSAQEAALLILAGAKNLLAQPAYRAILLAKSLKLSGFETARLDRLLTEEIKASYIIASGSKRGRDYSLTPTGYTKAFVLAKKRVGESIQ